MPFHGPSLGLVHNGLAAASNSNPQGVLKGQELPIAEARAMVAIDAVAGQERSFGKCASG